MTRTCSEVIRPLNGLRSANPSRLLSFICHKEILVLPFALLIELLKNWGHGHIAMISTFIARSCINFIWPLALFYDLMINILFSSDIEANNNERNSHDKSAFAKQRSNSQSRLRNINVTMYNFGAPKVR